MNERVVGNFKILSKVGEGGMGSVYRGIDMMLDRDVAIKVLRPELARDPQLVERFRKEAKTLAKLNHPAIAMIYSFFREGDELFLVMEFVEGVTLDKVLRDKGRFDPREAVRLFGVILEGIATAHRQGVIHRDIKPENIMVTPDGAAKIMDFGIAWMVGHARMTRDGHLVGTPHYMSPEQVKGEDPDIASDVYSLGAVLYELVTGRLPIVADSDFEIMRAHIERDPPPPRDLSGQVPVWLNDAVLQALAKDPGERFSDAASFGGTLARGAQEEWADDEPQNDKAPSPEGSGPPPTRVAGVPPTRLAAPPPPPPPTKLAGQSAGSPASPDEGGDGNGFSRAVAWFRDLGPAYWILAGTIVVAGLIILALSIAVISGGRNMGEMVAAAATPTPVTVVDVQGVQQGSAPQAPPGTGRKLPLPEPVVAEPTRVTPAQPVPTKPAPKKPTAVSPKPRDFPVPTAVPEPTQLAPTIDPVEEDRDREVESTTSRDPRDGAPSIGEALDMASEVENATDSLTKTLRRYLESNDRWRPKGEDLQLWESIKTLETTTDRFKSYVKKRRGLKILRKDTHPTGWTKNEIAEARARVSDMAGRIPGIERALSRSEVMPLIREMWRATRSEVEILEHQMSSD